jgi:hypothetical protein
MMVLNRRPPLDQEHTMMTSEPELALTLWSGLAPAMTGAGGAV